MITKLMGLMTIGIMLPTTVITTTTGALAKEVKVNTAEVQAITRSDGSIYINSGGTTVQVPSRRRYWTPWRSWRLPWQSHSENRPSCRQSSYQSTSRVSEAGSTIVQNSIDNSTCN